jgi:DNA polymerase III subunit epsilon
MARCVRKVSAVAGSVKSMSTWDSMPRAAFDLETTGRNSRAARIVTASVTVVDAAGDVIHEHEWLADPGVEIPTEASDVHGVTTERARREGRPAAEVTRELAAVLQDLFDSDVPVIAFNASYDFTVLAAESARYGVPQLHRFPVLDPYVMNKQVDRYRKGKRTLTALCEEYGVGLENAHTSSADALATLRVLDLMAGKFPKLVMPAPQLHRLQVEWAAAQAADFQAFLRKTKPTAVIEGDWPVLPPEDAGRDGF